MRKEIDPEKLLDMIRSILPSTMRSAQWAKATVKRRVCRSVRVALRGEADDVKRDAYVGHVVSRRRGADKLNHFMRWCDHLTKGMTVREALDYVRAILPHNLIGDHAYGHWKAHVRRRGHNGINYREWQRRNTQSTYDKLRFALRRAYRDRPEFLGELNAEIKARKMFDKPRRLLRGMHDVDAFARDVLTNDIYRIEYVTAEELSGRPSSRPRHLESAA
jgi:hypothetical protein